MDDMRQRGGVGGASWRKSSFSQPNGNACVEVRFTTGTDARHDVAMRDSKDRRGPVITFTVDQWLKFLYETIRGLPSCNGAVVVSTSEMTMDYGRGPELVRWHVQGLATGVTLRFRDDEWAAFRAGSESDEFGDGWRSWGSAVDDTNPRVSVMASS